MRMRARKKQIPRIHVTSEIGRLRRVMLHSPGPEIDRMMPSMMERLLFDDILDGELAREEHKSFATILENAGVEVLDAQSLLVDIVRKVGLPRDLVEHFETKLGGTPEGRKKLASMKPLEAARSLVGGILRKDPASGRVPRFFDLDPSPNYFFQRDPQAVLGDRVIVSAMATEARSREPLLAEHIFRHHPALAGHGEMFEIRTDPEQARFVGSFSAAAPTLEGGDVLVASSEVLLVGISERTNRRGVERLAEYLHREQTSFRHLILVELPPRRSYMHLDTVFTFIDHGACLAFSPLFEPNSANAAQVYYVDLCSSELTFAPRQSLFRTLGSLGIDLECVPCGGSASLIDQQREQWTDGANAFAIAPGVIVLYERNRRTLEELDRRGWRILDEDEAVEGKEPILGHGPTVVSLLGTELSRARGGPRCMTCPLERDDLEDGS